MGGTQRNLVLQFMAESLAVAGLAAVIGLALCELALPMINAAGGTSLGIVYLGAGSVLLVILAVAVAVGLCAGVYPALVISAFQPAAVLASAKTPGGGRNGSRVREGLVCLQFAIAIAFTVATGVILSQTHLLRTADIGFQRHGLIVVGSFEDDEVTGGQRQSLLQAWRSLPGISSVTAGDIAPGVDDNTNTESVLRPGESGHGVSINYVRTAPDFFQTYGARPIAGRLLDIDHGGDVSVPDPPSGSTGSKTRATRSVVANASAVRVLGFPSPQDAIGKSLVADHSLIIVGVVGDIRFRSPQKPIPPTLYFLRTSDIDGAVAGLRYDAADPAAVMGRVKAAWTRIAPGTPFVAKTIEEKLARYYQASDEHGRLFTMGAVLAVVIGCVGLYGLASFTTARRTKEIGIRKTLGASTGDVLGLLVGQFLRPVIIANLIAWPLAYVAMRSWLSGFDQRVALSPVYFVFAGVLALAIAGLTVAGQAWRVAEAEPARALRHE
jgi:putative ABC transport system permease protein